MPVPPYTIARYGVYLAVAVAALCVYLGHQAGATLDFALLRAVFVFVIFTALAFGAEAVVSIGWQPRPPAPRSLEAEPEQANE